MGSRIRGLLERRQQIKREKELLDQTPGLSCTSEPLRVVTNADLSRIFSRHETQQEWTQAEAELKLACQIEDGTTGGGNSGDRRAGWDLVNGLGGRSGLGIGARVGGP